MNKDECLQLVDEVTAFLLDCGGVYEKLTGEFQTNILECLAWGQYTLRRNAVGKLEHFICYWKIAPADIENVKDHIRPVVVNRGSIMYILEHGSKDHGANMRKIIKEIRGQAIGMQGVCWHHKNNEFIYYPGQKGTPVVMRRKATISICPTCYKEIFATVEETDAVYMVKNCCGVTTRSMVEIDKEFYLMLSHLENRDKSPFRGWIMIESTGKCNAACKYCYHENSLSEPTHKTLMEEIAIAATDSPNICLTGGEPTTRDDLPQIIEEMRGMGCYAAMVTNGIKLANKAYLSSLLSPAIYHDGIFWINLSLHNETNASGYQEKQKALENIKELGLRIADLFFTIDSIEQIAPILDEIRRHKDNIMGARIRAATNIYQENKVISHIFLSDIYKEVKRLVPSCEIMQTGDNNIYHINVVVDDVIVRLISWPDVSNIDLMSIKPYGPQIKAKSGKTCNLLHAQIINEGMGKGWLDGRKLC